MFPSFLNATEIKTNFGPLKYGGVDVEIQFFLKNILKIWFTIQLPAKLPTQFKLD